MIVGSWGRPRNPGVAYDHLSVEKGNWLRPGAREARGEVRTSSIGLRLTITSHKAIDVLTDLKIDNDHRRMIGRL